SLNPDGSSYGISDGIVDMIGAKPAECSIDLTNATMTVQFEPTHFDDGSQGFTITDPQFSGKKFGATLNFTELPQEGEYTGAVRLTIVN
ncbi:MAG: hypothetical protein IJF12_01130, partial [Alphaproteobacteria bacterium]|nr:hypothetical protein [Alphaproteobacteria bacterium]